MELLIKRVLQHDADVVVLTEFRPQESGAKIVKLLGEAGYTCSSPARVLAMTHTVLVGSRRPFTIVPLAGIPAGNEQRVLLAQFDGFAILGVYFAQKEEKRVLFDFIIQRCVPMLGERGAVVGDFNTGRAFLDEKESTFACIDSFEQLENSGLVDSWRSRNPDGREFSWYSRFGNGFRIDHIFSTPAMDRALTKIGYDHSPRIGKETDHSAMVAEFNL